MENFEAANNVRFRTVAENKELFAVYLLFFSPHH